jgi:hypothetical protein
MPFVVVKDETKLADIVARAYGKKLSAGERTRAIAAMERANPQLVARRPTPGTLIIVPRLPGLAPAAERAEEHPVAAGAHDVAGALQAYRKTLEVSLEAARARGEEVLEVIADKELRAAVAAVAGGSAQLDGIAAATKARLEAHARTEAVLGDIAKAADELADVGDRLA